MAPKQEWAFFAAPPPRSLKILEVILALPKKLFDSLTPDKQPKETQFGKTKENVAPRIDEIEVKLDKIFRRPGSPLFRK